MALPDHLATSTFCSTILFTGTLREEYSGAKRGLAQMVGSKDKERAPQIDFADFGRKHLLKDRNLSPEEKVKMQHLMDKLVWITLMTESRSRFGSKSRLETALEKDMDRLEKSEIATKNRLGLDRNNLNINKDDMKGLLKWLQKTGERSNTDVAKHIQIVHKLEANAHKAHRAGGMRRS